MTLPKHRDPFIIYSFFRSAREKSEPDLFALQSQRIRISHEGESIV